MVPINAGVAALVLAVIIPVEAASRFLAAAHRPHNILRHARRRAAGFRLVRFPTSVPTRRRHDRRPGLGQHHRRHRRRDPRLARSPGDPRQARHQRGCRPRVSSPAWSPSPLPAVTLTPVGSLILGAVAGALAAVAIGLKNKFGYDDSLDVVGVHLVAGLWGTIGIGLLAKG